MIRIFDENTLRAAYKIKLNLISDASNEAIREASFNYNSQSRKVNLEIAARAMKANSLAYKNSWANIVQVCNTVVLGLSSSESELLNVFEGYKNSLNSFGILKEELKKQNYLNQKKLQNENIFFQRFQSFEQQSLSNIDTLKHPKIIDYYFSRNNLCSVDNGLISLPEKAVRKISLEEIALSTRYSTFGKSEQDPENIKSRYTSHQYICKSKAPVVNGADLTYCIKLNKKGFFNKIIINDSSINYTTISKLFVLEGGEKIDIDYTLVNSGRDKILYINDPELKEYKIIYITFNQSKYIDIGTPSEDLKDKVLNGLNTQFDISNEEVLSYVYEFNIDLIEIYQSTYQNIGMFRLNETIDVSSYDLVELSWSGLYLDRLESIEVFFEGVFPLGNITGREVVSVEEYKRIDVSKYNSISLLFILNNKSNYSSYIKNIDVKAV